MDKKEIKTRMSREDRRLQIIDSAMNVFISKGYNGATTLDIAKEANISEVTLFRYFSSKQELFMEAIEPILMDTLNESIVAAKDLEPMEKLEFILTERIRLISKNHKVIRLILMESQINPELGDLDYIKKISLILKNIIVNMGVEMKNEDFSIRLFMGSILSFLYLPENNEENISNFVKSIISYVVK